MKKRVLAIVMAAVAVLGLAGCQKINSGNAYELQDYSKYVTLGEYKNLTIDVEKVEITDEDVAKQIESIRNEKATYNKVLDRVVAKDDTINMDFTGYMINEDGTKGEAFDKGSATDYDYTIGGTFISDLNDQLIGLTVGQEYDLKCTFPDDYTPNKDLAGVTVIFTVKVNSIRGDKILPEWTDEFVANYTNSKFTTTADYEKNIRETLEASAKQNQESTFEGNIWSQIIENSKITGYPEEALNKTYEMYYKDYFYAYASYYATMYGVTYEEFLTNYGKLIFGVSTDEEMKTLAMDYAKKEMDNIMIAVEISKAEGITIPTEEFESRANVIIESYSYGSMDTLLEKYTTDYLMEAFMLEKVNDFLTSNNKMNETVTVAPETTAAEETTAATK